MAESDDFLDQGDSAIGDASETANVVSLLQEYIQSCSSFSPHTKILTWSFEQQLEGTTSLQFRATVSFIFGGVPHFFTGGWQSSKKKAQRDTAERVRSYLSQKEGSPTNSSSQNAGCTMFPVLECDSLDETVLQELEEHAACGGSLGRSPESSLLEWEVEERGDASKGQNCSYRSIVTVYSGTLPHRFRGDWKDSPQRAHQDTAARVLWYIGKDVEAFTASQPALESNNGSLVNHVPPPVAEKGESKDKAVEDKTILMQVQNSLQKTFARDTPPGQRVWVWSYESDAHDPQLFRAHVEVPSWKRSFQGDWCRCKKLAQRNACLVVRKHLNDWLASSKPSGL